MLIWQFYMIFRKITKNTNTMFLKYTGRTILVTNCNESL